MTAANRNMMAMAAAMVANALTTVSWSFAWPVNAAFNVVGIAVGIGAVGLCVSAWRKAGHE